MLKPREQHIVLEVDILHDVVDQFAGPGIERLPRSTCAFGQDEAVRNGLQMAQKLAMPIMVVTHLRDRELTWGTVLLPHQREELCLFVAHMLLKFGLQRIEGIGEPPRRLGMTCMDSLDFPSQANELRQLTPMYLVIVAQDVVDQRAGCFGGRSGIARIERGERLLDCRNVQATLADSFGQNRVAAASEV